MVKNKEIMHEGIVEYTKGNKLFVRIEQKSPCISCSANKMCTSSDVAEKIIEVENYADKVYSIGDRVVIKAFQKLSLYAILLAFAIPLLILFISLIFVMNITNDEIVSGIVSLLFLLPYYLLLKTNKNRIKKTFVFYVNE